MLPLLGSIVYNVLRFLPLTYLWFYGKISKDQRFAEKTVFRR